MWRVLQFETICKVVCSLPKPNTFLQMIQIVPNPNQGIFPSCTYVVDASLVNLFSTNLSLSQYPKSYEKFG